MDGEAKFIDIECIIHLFQIITLLGSYANSVECLLLWYLPAGLDFLLLSLLSFRSFYSPLMQGVFKLFVWDSLSTILRGYQKLCLLPEDNQATLLKCSREVITLSSFLRPQNLISKVKRER